MPGAVVVCLSEGWWINHISGWISWYRDNPRSSLFLINPNFSVLLLLASHIFPLLCTTLWKQWTQSSCLSPVILCCNSCSFYCTFTQRDVAGNTMCVCVCVHVWRWPNCGGLGLAVSCVYFLVINSTQRGKAVPSLGHSSTQLTGPFHATGDKVRGNKHKALFAGIRKTV